MLTASGSIQNQKSLHVRMILFGESQNDAVLMSSLQLTDKELDQMRTKLVGSGRMSQIQFAEFAGNVFVDVYVLQTSNFFLSTQTTQRQKLRVTMSHKGIYKISRTNFSPFFSFDDFLEKL